MTSKKSEHRMTQLEDSQRSFFYMDWLSNGDDTYTLTTMLRSSEGRKNIIIEAHDTISSKEYMILKLRGRP